MHPCQLTLYIHGLKIMEPHILMLGVNEVQIVCQQWHKMSFNMTSYIILHKRFSFTLLLRLSACGAPSKKRAQSGKRSTGCGGRRAGGTDILRGYDLVLCSSATGSLFGSVLHRTHSWAVSAAQARLEEHKIWLDCKSDRRISRYFFICICCM